MWKTIRLSTIFKDYHFQIYFIDSKNFFRSRFSENIIWNLFIQIPNSSTEVFRYGEYVINDNTILIKIWFLSIFPNIKVHDQDLRWDSKKTEYSINRWSHKETL